MLKIRLKIYEKKGIFCVGTGGHVLPAKNLIMQLNDEGIDLDKFIISLMKEDHNI